MSNKLYNRFWVNVTIVLSVIFTAFFFPTVRQKHEVFTSLLLTCVGLLVIWASYLVRAVIFSRYFPNEVKK